MQATNICFCIFSLVVLGCVVAITVSYVSNPCCNKTDESYKVSNAHVHPMKGHTPVREIRHQPMAGAGPIDRGYIHDFASHPNIQKLAAQNEDMWARHGFVQ
jgi:hypothetical protein